MKTDAFFQDAKSKDNIKVIEETDETIREAFKTRYHLFEDNFFYEQFLNSGGLVIDNWNRIYGCGELNVVEKNEFYNQNQVVDILIGEDVLGGLFGLKDDVVFYYASDTNEWECLNLFYTEFLNWLVNRSSDVHTFYKMYRWPSWKSDCEQLKLKEGYSFYPLLPFECDIEKRSRKVISTDELIRFHLGI